MELIILLMDEHFLVILLMTKSMVKEVLDGQMEFVMKEYLQMIEGTLKDDQKHGNGTFHFSDGRYYNAIWINYRINQSNPITWPNGARYKGNFLDDYINGYGNAKFSDGRIYVGELQCVGDGRCN
jgi:hypothetical protein